MSKTKKTKKQIIVVPSGKKTIPKLKSKKTKHSPVEYYNCLLTQAQNNWLDSATGKRKKITQCCKDCRLNAPALTSQRNQEVKKLVLAYQQVGDSLTKLLRPLNK